MFPLLRQRREPRTSVGSRSAFAFSSCTAPLDGKMSPSKCTVPVLLYFKSLVKKHLHRATNGELLLDSDLAPGMSTSNCCGQLMSSNNGLGKWQVCPNGSCYYSFILPGIFLFSVVLFHPCVNSLFPVCGLWESGTIIFYVLVQC